MIAAGEYSDTLRALGQFLDRMGASTIEIINRGEDWLTASTLGSETLFEVFKLQDLREEGRVRRGLSEVAPCELADILRTLGQVLDAANATGFTICQVEEGFRISAAFNDGAVTQLFSMEDLRSLTSEQLRLRHTS